MNDSSVLVLASASVGESFSLPTRVSAAGAGVITRDPSAAEYEVGTEVEITATANLGYAF